ncbi:orotidine-5'-phosphate decarboxylase [Cytobacillus solani]|uniref:Orotidine 5'-phosphate decarboxylase n=1 Tax=Cytobacillus solani TaxID=1637975 RepID=A0A0Q3QN34_9BACI|nr:orotidine-5'-phosphate decarboxylase [Cytobacillus solani]KOP82077.1 orotidine 5'-phosphate decarboxylase [Bacillus sp. FJAT-21945]KQL19032.1 orotidine 5'-phosphate decarboxylase [Cytobacillus solani]USK56954.1 orotidine-5'-phosphate decarboxylase [Cytobacillus solani]
MDKSLIIALDFAGKQEVNQFLNHFNDEKLFLKVGMELFFQEGPSIIYDLKEKGHDIFLDLKLHDIPNTVKGAMKGLARLGCNLVNVHAAGGKEMMSAALEGLEAGTPAGQSRPACISVTQLTSTSEEQMREEQLVQVPLEESVLHYAALTKKAGLDGVVCSTFEAKSIRQILGQSFLTVAPGIRLQSDDVQDQKRVATPAYAKSEGASAIVVGRPITKSVNPLEKYIEFKQSWEGVHQ